MLSEIYGQEFKIHEDVCFLQKFSKKKQQIFQKSVFSSLEKNKVITSYRTIL